MNVILRQNDPYSGPTDAVRGTPQFLETIFGTPELLAVQELTLKYHKNRYVGENIVREVFLSIYGETKRALDRLGFLITLGEVPVDFKTSSTAQYLKSFGVQIDKSVIQPSPVASTPKPILPRLFEHRIPVVKPITVLGAPELYFGAELRNTIDSLPKIDSSVSQDNPLPIQKVYIKATKPVQMLPGDQDSIEGLLSLFYPKYYGERMDRQPPNDPGYRRQYATSSLEAGQYEVSYSFRRRYLHFGDTPIDTTFRQDELPNSVDLIELPDVPKRVKVAELASIYSQTWSLQGGKDHEQLRILLISRMGEITKRIIDFIMNGRGLPSCSDNPGYSLNLHTPKFGHRQVTPIPGPRARVPEWDTILGVTEVAAISQMGINMKWTNPTWFIVQRVVLICPDPAFPAPLNRTLIGVWLGHYSSETGEPVPDPPFN
ncbi:hypothetical protein TWF506_009258 [Arthrobotrys conoides]|uniref:Uncharacterized protein n=1 Tax=Arthrobotrys conoides TaxID=74498 RepID=A0AAN8NM99_9PEZI